MSTYPPDAKQDLVVETRYLAESSKSPEIAQAWFNGIRQAVLELVNMPQSFALARENDTFQIEVRQRVYKSHRILCTIHEDQSLVLVHRIWHTARDNAEADAMPGIS
jgi:plasmid stabilization system protein ParE